MCGTDLQDILNGMNEVMKRLPVERAVEDRRYIALHERLMGTGYVPIVDEFEKVGGKIYGWARLVPADSTRALEIYGKTNLQDACK